MNGEPFDSFPVAHDFAIIPATSHETMKRTLNTTINRSKNEKNDEFYTRVRKVTQEAATTFFYDGWDLIEERVSYTNGTSSTIHYYWGKDLSGTLQGAGGVGGLLYLTVDGAIYIPFYDNNGNVTRYLDANGNTVAQYTYDAFGKLIAKSGPLADFFRHRFSTKYCDIETGLYYYGYRFYSPTLMRWMNRDPIEEDGGLNVYAFCLNIPVASYDILGQLVQVFRYLPGRPPDRGWLWQDSKAETHWKDPDYQVQAIPCGEGKVSYKVIIRPPITIVNVYFRNVGGYVSPMHQEQEHIDAIIEYDNALNRYKIFLESVCECPQRALQLLDEQDKILDYVRRKTNAVHLKLDSPGGPHGH